MSDHLVSKQSAASAVYPVSKQTIVALVTEAFEDFRQGKFREMRLGAEVIPEKQVQAGILHELVVARFSRLAGFREGMQKHDKDIACIKDTRLSLEVKTASNPNRIAGNRHTAGKTEYSDPSGYFLCINFDPYLKDKTQRPRLRKIRFGWISADKWKPQNGKGQAATLSAETLDTLDLLYVQD
ncbi:ScaI family restriction endonuclease [Candidatus Micrarchaeota archaeon]|nr:ScaI family restriction endonuclease [Candidatus Micrarchaeota archaeon]